MDKPNLFSKISKSLFESDERIIQEIDREIEASVENIKATAFETVDAQEVLDQSSDEAGDTYFIMDLAPIYRVIGDRNGRVASSVEETCHRIFDRHAQSRGDRGNLEGDYFLMLFADTDNQANFLRAALMVNEIGTLVLSERFKALDVSDPITVLAVDDITNRDGTINTSRMQKKAKEGGNPLTMQMPNKNAPHWVKLLHQKKQRAFELVNVAHTSQEHKTDWQYAKPNEQRRLQQRSFNDRRQTSKAYPGADRRNIFDRRGRGY